MKGKQYLKNFKSLATFFVYLFSLFHQTVPAQSTSTHPTGGTILGYCKFGIKGITKNYGYSLFSNDFVGANLQGLDYTSNTNFTLNTAPSTRSVDSSSLTGPIISQVLNNSTALPLTITQFHALKNGTNVSITWNTFNEVHVKEFQVLKSTDGVSFLNIGRINAIGSNDMSCSYGFIDMRSTATDRLIYYKLKMVNQDSSFTFSSIRIIAPKESSPGFIIYSKPNTNTFRIKCETPTEALFTIVLTNNNGHIIKSWFDISTATLKHWVLDMKEFSSGTYHLQFFGNYGLLQHESIIKE